MDDRESSARNGQAFAVSMFHCLRITTALVVVSALICASTVEARLTRVPQLASPPIGYLQSFIEGATSGDTILVASGNYRENMVIEGKSVCLKAQTDGGFANVRPAGDDAIITIAGQKANQTVVSGFAFVGGTGKSIGSVKFGGAIYVSDASIKIANCSFDRNSARDGGAVLLGPLSSVGNLESTIESSYFSDNRADLNGGAILVASHQAKIVSCTFVRNQTASGDGGAIAASLWNTGIVIALNTFSYNLAMDHGGAIYVARDFGSTHAEVYQNLIHDNAAVGIGFGDTMSGSAIYVYGATVDIVSNTLAHNNARSEGTFGGTVALQGVPRANISLNIIAVNIDGGIALSGSDSGLASNDGPNVIWKNGDECCNSQIKAIQESPRFCSPSTSDYRVSATSPALLNSPPIGLFLSPGCASPIVRNRTWSEIKRGAG